MVECSTRNFWTQISGVHFFSAFIYRTVLERFLLIPRYKLQLQLLHLDFQVKFSVEKTKLCSEDYLCYLVVYMFDHSSIIC